MHSLQQVVIGRYISEAFNGVALHPVDVLDVGPRANNTSSTLKEVRSEWVAGSSTGQSPRGPVLNDDDADKISYFSDSDNDGSSMRIADERHDASTHRETPVLLLAQLVDPLLTTIAPVNAVHPTWNAIATGSSRSIYLWGPRAGPRRPSRVNGTTRRSSEAAVARVHPEGRVMGWRSVDLERPWEGERRGLGSIPVLTRDLHHQRWSWCGSRDGSEPMVLGPLSCAEMSNPPAYTDSSPLYNPDTGNAFRSSPGHRSENSDDSDVGGQDMVQANPQRVQRRRVSRSGRFISNMKSHSIVQNGAVEGAHATPAAVVVNSTSDTVRNPTLQHFSASSSGHGFRRKNKVSLAALSSPSLSVTRQVQPLSPSRQRDDHNAHDDASRSQWQPAPSTSAASAEQGSQSEPDLVPTNVKALVTVASLPVARARLSVNSAIPLAAVLHSQVQPAVHLPQSVAATASDTARASGTGIGSSLGVDPLAPQAADESLGRATNSPFPQGP